MIKFKVYNNNNNSLNLQKSTNILLISKIALALVIVNRGVFVLIINKKMEKRNKVVISKLKLKTFKILN